MWILFKLVLKLKPQSPCVQPKTQKIFLIFNRMHTKILLIYTGGTIGMVKAAHSESLQAFDFQNLLKNIPELKLLNCEIDTISFEIRMIIIDH